MVILSLAMQRQPSLLLVVILMVSLLIAGGASPSHCDGGAPEFRSAARDAVNAAWLLASLNCDPAIAQAIPLPASGTVRESTFDQVTTLTDSIGVKTELRRLNYSDLCALHSPSVVLLRHGPQAAGFFAVVLNATPGQVTTINAGWLTVVVYSEDEFRLRWTGHALVPHRDRPTPYAIAVPLFILGCIIPMALAPGRRLLQNFQSRISIVRRRQRPRATLRRTSQPAEDCGQSGNDAS